MDSREVIAADPARGRGAPDRYSRNRQEDRRAHRPGAQGSLDETRVAGRGWSGARRIRDDRLREDLLSALQNLGYHRPQAEKAIDALAADDPMLARGGASRSALRELRAARDDEALNVDERLITPGRVDEDAQYEAGLRPRTLDEYIGQDRLRDNLQVSIAAARGRREALDHVLLYGPPGLGKTTLAYVIGNEMGVPVRATAGPVIERPGDLAGMLTDLQEHAVLFIDEIHRLAPAIEEILYPAMEDYELDIIIGQGPGARSVKVPLQKFTLIGATTRAGLLTSPLRARFGIVHRLDFYTNKDIEEIVRRSARILGVTLLDDAAAEIGRRSRGTPRIANRLLRRVRDYAQVRADGRITGDVAQKRDDACSKWTTMGSTKSIASCCERSSTSSAAVQSA